MKKIIDIQFVIKPKSPSDHYFGQSGRLGVPQKNLRLRCWMLPLLVSVRNDNICHGSQINNGGMTTTARSDTAMMFADIMGQVTDRKKA